MPALNLALNADFEKKHWKSIIEYFSSIICTFANKNGWKTDENLKLAKRLQVACCEKPSSSFQLKFRA